MTCSAQGSMRAVPHSLQLRQDSFVGFISAGVYHALYLYELHPPFISGSLISLCLHVEVWLYDWCSHSFRDVATLTVCPYAPMSSSSCNWRPHGVTNRRTCHHLYFFSVATIVCGGMLSTPFGHSKSCVLSSLDTMSWSQRVIEPFPNFPHSSLFSAVVRVFS